MRILIVVEPGIDGVFRHVEGLVHYLLGQEQEVHLAYSSRRGSAHLDTLVALVRERGGDCLDLGVGNAPERADFPALLRLRAMAARLRPEIIHAHSSKAGVLARSLALLGIPARYFYSSHAYYGLAPRPGVAVHFYNLAESFFGRIGATINISPDEAAFATGRLGISRRKIRVIHNPVDTAIFRPGTAEERARQRRTLGIPPDAVVLGALGRLSFQKDPQTLYLAAASALRPRPEVVLCHIGQGELDAQLQALAVELGIAGQVIRHPYLDEPAGFYHALDGFAVTSRYEAGWPLVMLEALASGLPIIASIAPGMSDLGSAGLSHCWTAPAGDARGFTAAIEAWLSDLPARRASNHRTIAEQRFAPAAAYGSILAAYREEATPSIPPSAGKSTR